MTRFAVFACCALALAGCSDTGSGAAAASGGAAGSALGSGGQAVNGGGAAGALSQVGGSVETSGGGGQSAGAAAAGTGPASGAGGLASGGAAAGGSAGSGGSGGVIDEPGPASSVGFDWGKAVIDTRLATNPNFGLAYQDGLALRGIFLAYKRLKDPKYLDALTKAADGYSAPAGMSLDEMMHMEAVADAFELTKKESYRVPAQNSRKVFDTYQKSDGVFWHAQTAARQHQLWADGVFMSLAFLTRYGTVFEDPTVWPIAATQLVNTQKHLLNPATGLLWHAWDESGVVAWSKHPSQTNEIHWGRAMGWFALASVMTLEALPEGDPGRAPVAARLKDLLTALAKYQDKTTGRWFQVVDMPTDAQNWLETSCSSMFSYAFWWAYKHRVVDASFADVAKKGFQGVLQKLTKDANNRTTVATTCTGLSASDDLVGNYFNHPRADNEPHGIGIFLLMWEGMQ
jgi:unsaturated rhamnogalacturonyl hydrolase